MGEVAHKKMGDLAQFRKTIISVRARVRVRVLSVKQDQKYFLQIKYMLDENIFP